MKETRTPIPEVPAAPGPTRPQRADARRNRERILEAARAEFALRGDEAQMDDVARRAGVGVGTVYRHFPTKEALMVELVRQKFVGFRREVERALGEGGDPFEALAGVLRRNAEVAAGDGAARFALTGLDASAFAAVEPELAALRRATEELMEPARRAGALRPDATADDIPMLMCGVSATMGHPRPGFDWRRHLELVIDGLRAR